MHMAMTQDIMQRADHATHAQSDEAHEHERDLLLQQKAHQERQCVAACAKVLRVRGSEGEAAARHELRCLVQHGREVISKLEALQGSGRSCYLYYKDEYERLDKQLQQQKEQHASPALILLTTEQRESALHHICTDILFMSLIKFAEYDQKVEAARDRLLALDLHQLVAQLKQRQRLELGAPNDASFAELTSRLADRQRVSGCRCFLRLQLNQPNDQQSVRHLHLATDLTAS